MSAKKARIISITNQKGGVGKTTTTVNLASSLAHYQKKTLIIDLDPQANASSALGLDKDSLRSKPNIYHALIGNTPLHDVLCPTPIPELFIAPSSSDLAGAEVELVGSIARESRLKKALAEVSAMFDYILIDCPPSLGLLTINALTASDSFLVPLQCEYFALEGLTQLLQTVSLIKQSVNPTLYHEGIVLTMFDSRNKLAHAVVSEVKEHFKTKVFDSVIPRNIRLSECSSHGTPIIIYDPESKGCMAYLGLAQEFITWTSAASQTALSL